MNLISRIVQSYRCSRGTFKNVKTFCKWPSQKFANQGYELLGDFLPQQECDRLRNLFDSIYQDRSYIVQGNCYLVCRGQQSGGHDTQVSQLMNAQELDPFLNELFKSRKIESLFEERVGVPMKLQSLTIQLDGLDTTTKRGYHIDSAILPNYKAFIYLNDVEKTGDGPYTLVPGSHRHILRKVVNFFYNALRNRPITDMSLFYSDSKASYFLDKAGKLIISCQQCSHKGWSYQDQKSRYNLIAYLIEARHDTGAPFTLGKNAY